MPGAKIDAKLRLSLREGAVDYFVHHAITSPEPHYFIVVNSDPVAQQVLLLTVVTSKIEKVKLRRKESPETLVEMGPADFSILTKPSIVDCNDLKEIALPDFNRQFTGNKIKYFDKDLPPALRKALCAAIHASTVVSEEIKALVSKP